MELQLQTLIDTVARHTTGWYVARWSGVREYSELPTTTRQDFLTTPLSKRRYKDERALVKIVHTPEGPFLSEWAFTDIAAEPWGIVTDRPMVYLTDPHSAIEKSMWCYEQNRVPLIGEKSADIASIAAKKYDIDSLIADPGSVMRMLPYLKSRTNPLKALTLVGESFDVADLGVLRPYAEEIRLVLAFPETGVLGVAALSEMPVFVAPENTLVEIVDGELVFTKVTLLSTPVIRYGSTLRGSFAKDGRSFTIQP